MDKIKMDYKRQSIPNALTAIGYLLREFCKFLLAFILIIALGINWESIGL